jgi:hypothetical protein
MSVVKAKGEEEGGVKDVVVEGTVPEPVKQTQLM